MKAGFVAEWAWWYLSAQQRSELDAARDAGLYGGSSKPLYWYLQETMTYPHPPGGGNPASAEYIARSRERVASKAEVAMRSAISSIA